LLPRGGEGRGAAKQTRSPWSLAFLPDNKGLLVTLKGGQLKRWQAGKGLSDPIVGVPKVWANGQGGLLDVVLAPDFENRAASG
jgi:glucose/arabinose dehydrogenase